jgi:hypothetical protein
MARYRERKLEKVVMACLCEIGKRVVLPGSEGEMVDERVKSLCPRGQHEDAVFADEQAGGDKLISEDEEQSTKRKSVKSRSGETSAPDTESLGFNELFLGIYELLLPAVILVQACIK